MTRQLERFAWFVAGTILSVCLATPAVAQDAASADLAALIAQTKTRYAADEWPQSARRAGVALGELKLDGYTAGPPRHIAGRITREFQGKGELPPFLVELEVRASAADAHDVLVTWLAGLAGAKKAPTASELKMPVGDAGYVGLAGPGPGAISWIAFARGNLAVRVLAPDPKQWPLRFLGAVAQAIDEKIEAQPALGAGDALPVPTIERLRADRTEVAAGDAVSLELDVVDPSGGTPSIAWSVGGEGLGYVEKRDGEWKLFTTGPGSLWVEAEVTGAMGTTTTKRIELQITDRRR